MEAIILGQMFDRSEYAEYEARLLAHLESDPSDSALRRNLANLFSMNGTALEVAEIHLGDCASFRPDDEQGRLWLARLSCVGGAA